MHQQYTLEELRQLVTMMRAGSTFGLQGKAAREYLASLRGEISRREAR